MSDVMAELQKVRAQLEEMKRGRGDALAQQAEPQPQPSQAEPQTYTWDQIQQAVQNGEITEATGHQIWAGQQQRTAEETARRVAREEREREQRETRLDREIQAYHAKIPGLKVEGSEEAAQVKAEYQNLVEMGYADNKQTALVALSRVYGPAKAIAKPSDKEPARDTHREGTSGPDDTGDDGESNDNSAGSPPSTLNADQKRYYRRAMESGIYKDWDEVREELKFAKKK